MSSKFTQKAEIALNKSVNIAEEFGHTYIGTEHVLIAISEDESSCASVIMKKCGLTHVSLCDAVKTHSGIGKRTRLTSKETTPRCRKILESSYKIAKKFSAEKIGTEHLLLAILEERDSVALKIISKLGISHTSLKDATLLFLRSSERAMQSKESADVSLPFLKKYAKNMTKVAADLGYDPVIGREGEIDRLIRILSRRSKNNPCLIGEAGVGKTAVVEGLAQRIADGDAPIFLRGKSIYSVDFTAMVAGAKYRGDFEERIKGLMDEARGNKDIILFVDEIHTIVGAGSAEGAIDAANIMKPELARGDIRVIGATTATEYKKHIEKDSALERRFQPISIEEPSRDKAIEILLGLKERYEEHHNVIIDNSAIEASVDLSMRYINDRFLPDKAIDLLDEACAKEALLVSDNIQEKTRYCYDKLKQLYGDGFIFDEDFVDDDAMEIDTEIHNKIIEDLRYDHILRPKITSKNIMEVICEVIGVDTFNSSDNLSYDNIVNVLESKIVGQGRAIQALADSILRCSCGISSTYRPKGVFLFVGGSGVGKTALAKECAKVLFKSDESLIRLDMSEYSESYSTSKLIGSAPGYVGYDERLSVLEKIRKHPYSILLLDEIEKAHPDVIALFLQIFDYGFIKDSSGRSISFRNTYIIMTSNVGADIKRGNIGFFSTTDSDNIENELKKHFKVEFINRIDEIIPFNQLSMNDLVKITSIKLNDVADRLKRFPIDFSVDESVINHIAGHAMRKGLGARPIDRIIAKDIEAPLARIILKKSQPGVLRARFDIQDEKITLTKSCPQLQG